MAPILPSDAPIVLFDGECGLCNRSVQFIARHDALGVVRFAPLQSDVGIRLRERVHAPPDMSSMVVIDRQRAYLKSDAAIHIARRLRFPWNLLRLLVLLPRPLRDWGYDVVASNRFRWFGRADACRQPPPGLRERLLI